MSPGNIEDDWDVSDNDSGEAEEEIFLITFQEVINVFSSRKATS